MNFRCDYKYLDVVDGWMKLHEIPANWHEARLRCHLEGAVLASPLNSNLKFAMASMMILKTPKQSVLQESMRPSQEETFSLLKEYL